MCAMFELFELFAPFALSASAKFCTKVWGESSAEERFHQAACGLVGRVRSQSAMSEDLPNPAGALAQMSRKASPSPRAS